MAAFQRPKTVPEWLTREAPGIVPSAPGIIPSVQGTVPSAPGSVPSAQGIVPSAPGFVPSAQGIIPSAPGIIPSAPAAVPGGPKTSGGRGGISPKRLGRTFGDKTPIRTGTLPAPALAEATGREAPSLPAPQATHAMHSSISPKATTPGRLAIFKAQRAQARSARICPVARTLRARI